MTAPTLSERWQREAEVFGHFLIPVEGTVAKYSEDQDRDAIGRWTASGGGTWPAPKTTKAGLEDAISAWSGIHFADLRAYMREGHVREGSTPENDPTHGITDARAAQSVSTLTHAIANGQEAPTLYRGLSVSASDHARFSALQPGDHLDLAISAWTSDRGQATRYAGGITAYAGTSLARGEQGLPVVLQAEGVTGLDMSTHSFYPDEKEWLTDGRFEVVSVRVEPGHVPVVGSDILVVTLTQSHAFVTASENAGKE